MIPMACNLQLPGFTPWPQCFLVQLAESDPWAHGHGLCRVYDRVLNRMQHLSAFNMVSATPDA